MKKFKAGDRVRLIDNTGMVAPKGMTATVRGYSSIYVNIKWDEGTTQRDGGYYEEQFELFGSPCYVVVLNRTLYENVDDAIAAATKIAAAIGQPVEVEATYEDR